MQCLVLPASAQLGTLQKIAVAAQGLMKLHEAASISDEQLAEYMSQSMKQLDKQNKVSSSGSSYSVRLNRITKGMKEIDGIPLNFKVYEKDEMNAFASPDGSVRVYSKLMDAMSDDELLGVIGHELGHLAHRDSKKEYRMALLTSAVRDGLMLSDGTIGQIAYSSLGSIGESVINAKYSRDQEAAADDFGYEYLKQQGKNPWAMSMAFEKMRDMSSDSSNKYFRYAKELVSTHPDLERRIETMAKKAEKEGYRRP